MQNEQAFIYKTTGEIIPVLPKNKKDFTLDELQSVVGGHIEIASLECGRIMVLNEEGKLNDLDYNAQATHLYNRMPHDFIVGDVLVTPRAFIN